MIARVKGFWKADDMRFIVKWVGRILELAVLISAIRLFYAIFEQQYRLTTLEEYKAFTAALEALSATTARGGSLLTGTIAYFTSIIGLPAVYALLWIRRIFKWSMRTKPVKGAAL